MGKELLIATSDQKVLAFKNRVSHFLDIFEAKRIKADSTEEIDERKNFLKCALFSDEQIRKISRFRKTLYPINTLYHNIVGLLSVDIDDYQKVMSDNPRMIVSEDKDIGEIFKSLIDLGFSKYQLIRDIYLVPSILIMDLETVKDRIDKYGKMGFNILTSSKDVKLLPYDCETIKDKVDQYKSLGFKDPVDVYRNNNSSGINGVKNKVEIIKRMCSECGIDVNPLDLIEGAKVSLSASKERLEIIALFFKYFNYDKNNIVANFHEIIYSNINNNLISYINREDDKEIIGLIRRSRQIKNGDLDEISKVMYIINYFNDPNHNTEIDKKIFEFYKKGYLDK